VWIWKTGDLVRFYGSKGYALLNLSLQILNHLSTDRGEVNISGASNVFFLDEFRLAVTPFGPNITGLVVFNTLISQGYPGYFQQLEFPPGFSSRNVRIRLDRDRHLGIQNRHMTLVADPAQAVLVVGLRNTRAPPVLLIIQMQVSIQQVCSVRADLCVPWGEWSRGAVAIEVRARASYVPSTFVHGAQVMVLRDVVVRGRHEVHTPDFSQRSTLPLQRGAGVAERRVFFEDGAKPKFQSGNPDARKAGFLSLNDGSLFYLASCFPFHRKLIRVI